MNQFVRVVLRIQSYIKDLTVYLDDLKGFEKIQKYFCLFVCESVIVRVTEY